MGIRGLQAWLKYNSCLPRVLLKDLVERVRDQSPSKKDIIAVVDGNNFLHFMVPSAQETFCGGNYKVYIDHLHRYVQGLLDLGIKPVFFFNGPWNVDKLNCQNRQLDHLHKCMKFYEELQVKGESETSMVPNMLFYCTVCYLEKQKIQVVVTTDQVDPVIVKYALENSASFIMSDDTTFILYPTGGIFHVSQSHQHMDLEEMSSVYFDKEKISQLMGTEINSLPLFGGLTENVWLNGALLRGLYIRIIGAKNALSAFDNEDFFHQHSRIIIPKLAEFIKNGLINSSDIITAIQDCAWNGYPRWRLKKYAEKLLGPHKSDQDLRNELGRQVTLALSKFGYKARNFQLAATDVVGIEDNVENIFSDEFLNYAHQKIAAYTTSISLFCLLRNKISLLYSAYEDPSLTEKRGTNFALMSLRRRLYGILFGEAVDVSIAEWSIRRREFYVEVVKPILPDFPVPDFQELLGFVGTNINTEARWKLFVWGVLGKVSSERARTFERSLKELPGFLMIPFSAVYIMNDAQLLENLQYPGRDIVKMFLKTFIISHNISVRQMRDIHVRHINPIATHLCAALMRCCEYVVVLNEAVGTGISNQQINFSAAVFQKYFEANDDSSFPDSNIISMVENVL